MYSFLSKAAWNATVALGGLILMSASSARADDARRERRGREDRGVHSATARGHHDRRHSTTDTRESRHGRLHAAGGHRRSREHTVSRTSHERYRDGRHEGRWERGGWHRRPTSTHHRVSMHWKHGRDSQHRGNHGRARSGARWHSERNRHHGRSERRFGRDRTTERRRTDRESR
jgi:hypothetical protein